MKKKIIPVLVIFCILTLGAFYKVKADAGFDNSYGGGSSSSGSSWGSSSSSGSSWGSTGSYSSGSLDGPIPVFIIIGVVVFVVFIVLSSKKDTYTGSLPTLKKLTEEQAKEIDPSINVNELIDFTYQSYVEIQESWMNFELEKIRLLVTDELYNMYAMQLKTLEVSHQQNKMLEIEKITCHLSDLVKKGATETATLYLKVRCLDYIINKDNQKVLRGSSTRKLEVAYKIILTRTIGVIGNHEHYIERNCPNCGAPTKVNASGICEYCNAVLVSKEHEWVVSSKQNLGQRML